MNNQSRILIIGHNDSLENSFWNYFSSKKFNNVYTNSRHSLNVLSQSQVEKFFKDVKPEYVFLGSVRSGGIAVNQKYPADFIYENLAANNHIVHAASQYKVKKLVYFGASCVYPKEAKQPIKENSLYTGIMEETSDAYSTAKLAGIKLCQTYRAQYGLNALCIVPATLYGPHSDTNLETAHVMGALIAKFDQAIKAKQLEVTVWGTGKARREFLYVDDFVQGVLFLMNKYDSADLINLGVSSDITIKDLAYTIAKASGFKGKIIFDRTKPDGAMRKLLDSSRVKKLGWKPKMNLEKGIKNTINWYRKEVK
jgi:GDP-L-fucose synthase